MKASLLIFLVLGVLLQIDAQKKGGKMNGKKGGRGKSPQAGKEKSYDFFLPTVAKTTCRSDVARFCEEALAKRDVIPVVACLSTHRDEITEACRSMINATVPFQCAEDIELYCPKEVNNNEMLGGFGGKFNGKGKGKGKRMGKGKGKGQGPRPGPMRHMLQFDESEGESTKPVDTLEITEGQSITTIVGPLATRVKCVNEKKDTFNNKCKAVLSEAWTEKKMLRGIDASKEIEDADMYLLLSFALAAPSFEVKSNDHGSHMTHMLIFAVFVMVSFMTVGCFVCYKLNQDTGEARLISHTQNAAFTDFNDEEDIPLQRRTSDTSAPL